MFENFEDHSRVWIYQCNRVLNQTEIESISKKGNGFIDSWNSHGTSLFSSFQVVNGVFLVFVVDEIKANASGCSIDKSVELVRSIDEEYSLDLFNRFSFAAKDDNGDVFTGHLQSDVSRLKKETKVFNNLVTNLGELRNSWIMEAQDSWHKQFIAN